MSSGGRRCIVGGCSNASNLSYKWDELITLHKFPKNEPMRSQWISFVKSTRADKFTVGSFAFICNKHFQDDCFENKLQFLMMAEREYKETKQIRSQ